MKLCVLVPALNCADVLPELRARLTLPGPDDEVIVVDDCSDDATAEVAASLPQVYAERNAARRGYGGTSHRLYEIALARGADLSVNIHGDLGHRPEDVARLLPMLRDGYDVVLGSRLLHVQGQARRLGWHRLFSREVASGFPPVRVVGHLTLTWFQNTCYGTRLHSFHEGMRGCSRAAMEWAVRTPLPQWYNYDLELLLAASRAGLRIGEVAVPPNYDHRARSAAPPIRYGLKVVRHAVGDRWRQTFQRGPAPRP